jgi:hypothetical protein
MPDFRLPLSGDVVQAINPWSWTWNLGGAQLGLVNINLGRSSNPELEAQILDEVGSYGRQIGRLGDVLAILLRRLDPSALTPEEATQIEDFQRQIAEVERLKARR